MSGHIYKPTSKSSLRSLRRRPADAASLPSSNPARGAHNLQQAEQSKACRFKVVKESGKSCLAAALHHHHGQHEISNGFLLMPMRVGQDEADILAEASGRRVSSHRKPMLSRVTDS